MWALVLTRKLWSDDSAARSWLNGLTGEFVECSPVCELFTRSVRCARVGLYFLYIPTSDFSELCIPQQMLKYQGVIPWYLSKLLTCLHLLVFACITDFNACLYDWRPILLLSHFTKASATVHIVLNMGSMLCWAHPLLCACSISRSHFYMIPSAAASWSLHANGFIVAPWG